MAAGSVEGEHSARARRCVERRALGDGAECPDDGVVGIVARGSSMPPRQAGYGVKWLNAARLLYVYYHLHAEVLQYCTGLQ